MKRRNREKLFILAAIVIVLVLGIYSVLKNGQSNLVSNGVGTIFSPVSGVFMSIKETVSETFGAVINIKNLREENKALVEEVALLKEENRLLGDVVARSELLTEEYELKKAARHNYVEASITNKEPGDRYARFVINVGEKDGVAVGDNVVIADRYDDRVVVDCLVGRVFEVGLNWAKVVSIIDDSNSIAFKNMRTQDGGILNGYTNDALSGYLFDNSADVIKDDKIFTSGLGDGFEKDIYIGKIKSVLASEKNLIKELEVEPGADFKKLYEVFVIVNGGESNE